MARREVFEFLNGYDEQLAYEDFDFLIRAARQFNFMYSPEVLVKKRITSGAMVKRQFQLFSKDAETTFVVCEKILKMNQSEQEQHALRKRIFYEMRLNFRLLNFRLVFRYLGLLKRNSEKVFR